MMKPVNKPMTVNYQHHVTVPSKVIFRELLGEAVVLNLGNEKYYSLDDIGTRVWQLLTGSATIEQAYQALLVEYDVEPDVLRKDLDDILNRLLENELIHLTDAAQPG